MQKSKELDKILAKAKELFGVEINLDDLPVETPSDQAREAQSAMWYFETRGVPFKEKPCKQCEKIFAYCWNVNSISYCSIACAKLSLREIGLDWNPAKEPSERWGRHVPAVVSPQALDLLKDSLSLQEDPGF